MAKTDVKKTINDVKRSPSKMAAGLVGALAGAAIGTGAAIYFSDKKNREKALETASELGSKAVETLKEANEYAEKDVKAKNLK